MSITSRQAVEAMKRESQDWFEVAFQTHWPRLYAVLYRLVGDADEAQDLASEAFWRLFRQPPADRSPQMLGGWLYRTGTRLGLNALRARQRRQRYEKHAGELHLQEHAPSDPARQVEQRQEQDRVHRALARMKPHMAQLLVLRHSGLSYAEVAQALDIAAGSVGTLLARAEAEFERRYLEAP